MVIMWPNADGTVTLSQRQASAEVMPTPVASPALVATAVPSLSTGLSSSQPQLAFTISGSATKQNIIWAFGGTKPAAAPDSTLVQHLESGATTLDLTQTLASSTGNSGSSSVDVPLLPYQKTIIAHAAVATFGFLFLLPAGALLARFTRTTSSKWYSGHWIIQAGIGGPVVIVGCILGFVAAHQMGAETHTTHKTLGVVLLALYIVQCALGAFIHYVKIPFRFGRPPQNYAHAVLGLTTIGLALYQVRLGYREEWPNATGRGPIDNGVNIVWIVWVVLLPVLYFGGLAYLPRQLRQEREAKQRQEYNMTRQENKLSERTPSLSA